MGDGHSPTLRLFHLPRKSKSRSITKRMLRYKFADSTPWSATSPRQTRENHPLAPLLNQEGNLVYELCGVTDEGRTIVENT